MCSNPGPVELPGGEMGNLVTEHLALQTLGFFEHETGKPDGLIVQERFTQGSGHTPAVLE